MNVNRKNKSNKCTYFKQTKKIYILFNICINYCNTYKIDVFRFVDADETQEKETAIKKKKKKKKSSKNVFKVEVLPNNSNTLQNENGNISKQIKNDNPIIKNCKKIQIDHTQSGNKIVKNVKKVEKHSTENENEIIEHVKNDIKYQMNFTQNKYKIIKNIKRSGKHLIDHSENKNKNVKRGEKRKMDHTQNGLNKKRKFFDKKFKFNKEPSTLESLTDDRLKAYGINPKKFRNKLKFGNN